jgi:DNA-binding HxlR family transcriptional regulator
MHYSLARTLQRIGSRWSPLAMSDLALGASRFEQLAEDLGLPRGTLADLLRGLVERGLVERTPYQHNPIRHDYKLSEAGRELMPVFMAMTAWGERWTMPEGGPTVCFRHRPCGHFISPRVDCPKCGAPITLDEVDVHAGPGRLVGPRTMLQRVFIATRR